MKLMKTMMQMRQLIGKITISMKFIKTMKSLHIIQDKINAKKKELEETLEQKAGKEDFRTLKEFNQLLKRQMELAESKAEGKTWSVYRCRFLILFDNICMVELSSNFSITE